jgi:GNAT superfamily N-acetyltransferase
VIRVRVLGPDDWELRRSLRLAALLDTPWAFGSVYEVSAARTEEDWRGWASAGRIFGAFRGERACGLVGVTPRAGEDGWADLFAMWVEPDARGHGAADALMGAALGWADEQRVGVRLAVAEGNERAERVYARNGFVRVDEPDHRECDLVMRRPFPLVTPAEPT